MLWSYEDDFWDDVHVMSHRSDDGRKKNLRNVSKLLPDSRWNILEDSYRQTRRREDLKSSNHPLIPLSKPKIMVINYWLDKMQLSLWIKFNTI